MQPMKFIHMRPDPGQGLGGITICYRAQLDPARNVHDIQWAMFEQLNKMYNKKIGRQASSGRLVKGRTMEMTIPAEVDPKTPAFDETICRKVMEFAVFRHTGQRITIV